MNVIKRNNVHVVGDGQMTMVFSHGFGCDQSMWRYVAPTFESRYRTVLFDLVGSGGSDLASYDFAKYSSLNGYVDDILEILADVEAPPVVFVGHSVSAMIGMLAAIKAPERFAANVMVGPSPSFINDGAYPGGFARADIEELLETLENNFLGWSSTMAPAIMGAPEQPQLSEELVNSFCRTDPDIARHFARVTFLADHRAEMSRVTTPTLIVQSNDDFLAPVSVGEYMHQHIPGSRLAIVKNIGHCPHLSAPSASVDAIESFLHETGL
ncbi:alpha/beta hydrolase [Caballeronia temeraria]|uniref:Alpha/beta hydrolase n=1 Tax=Caballeronia temeraria TaxID=1777137 RepID=A0A158AIM6_9BURK|nr:alpha/beta hydrolase [Caballeronia temeraria]SAK56897.1 alpha/beta hydrolase [Caballeronia temeraria]